MISHRCHHSLSRLHPSVTLVFSVRTRHPKQRLPDPGLEIQKEGMFRFFSWPVSSQSFAPSHIQQTPRHLGFSLLHRGKFCTLESLLLLFPLPQGLKWLTVTALNFHCCIQEFLCQRRTKQLTPHPSFTLDLCISYNLFTF